MSDVGRSRTRRRWRRWRAVWKSSSSALQFLVCRGLREVLLTPRGRGYPSEVVSGFGPKPGPRCRDNLTHWLISTQVARENRRMAEPFKKAKEDVAVLTCVEINQCVGCTRQFFTKSFLGDDAAVLARSSGEEPALPRHRAGVASMAWRTTR